MPLILEKLQPFLNWLLQASWQASILAALILLLQRLFRRFLPPSWAFGLWLVLLLRLLLPIAPSSQFSLFNYVNFAELIFTSEDEGQALVTGQGIGMGVSALGNEQPSPSAQTTPISESAIHFPLLLFGLWSAGAIIFLARTTYVNIGILSHAKKLRPLVNNEILELLENCKSELRVHVPVSIVVTSKVQSPALLGFIRPRLLLPENILHALTPAELRHVFLHELAHIKRLDIFCNWIITFLQIVHWFNPILWFAFNRMRSDLEIACDSLALSTPSKNRRREYGETIIKVLELTTRISPLPGTVGILEDKDYMKRRIRQISDTAISSQRWPFIGILLMASLTLTALTNPRVSQNPEELLQRMKVAYERQDLNGLMAMYAKNAIYQEIGLDGKPYSTLDLQAIEQFYRFNLTQNPKFDYSNVVAKGDTLEFHGAWRSGLFEVIGLYEVEGDGQFVLRDGLIVQARWREVPNLKKRRMELFDSFIAWLKAEKPQEYASMFSHELFVMHRATGDKVNELFLEWVAAKVNPQPERRVISMNDLPEVKRIRLDQDIIALCKEFRGPYADAPKYVTEVKSYFDAQKIAYRHQHVLGIYFDDPNQPNPETHRSIQGVVVDKEVAVKPPYFVYKMKKGDEYLYTKVKGNPIDTHLFIPAGYMAIFNYMGVKKIQAGSTGGHQVVTMEDGQVVFEIYLKID